MAIQEFYIGTVGPLLIDDDDPLFTDDRQLVTKGSFRADEHAANASNNGLLTKQKYLDIESNKLPIDVSSTTPNAKLGTNHLGARGQAYRGRMQGYIQGAVDETEDYGYDWNMTPDQIEWSYKVMAEMGVKWVREWAAPLKIDSRLADLNGAMIDPQESDGWAAVDKMVEMSRKYGMKIILVIDITNKIGSYVTHGGNNYRALDSHTSSAATEPGVGANWQEHWVDVTGRVMFGQGALATFTPVPWATSTAYIGDYHNNTAFIDNWCVPMATFIANRYKDYSDIVTIEPMNEAEHRFWSFNIDANNPAGTYYTVAGTSFYSDGVDSHLIEMQSKVYDAVKAVAPGMKVQLSSSSSSAQLFILDLLTTADIGYGPGNSATGLLVNQFDSWISMHTYQNPDTCIPPNFRATKVDGVSTIDYVNAVYAKAIALGRSDVKMAIDEFGLFWQFSGGANGAGADVAVTHGSPIVTGTRFVANVNKVGDVIRDVRDNSRYTIKTIDSETQITFNENYIGATSATANFLNETAEQRSADDLEWYFNWATNTDHIDRILYWRLLGTDLAREYSSNLFLGYGQGLATNDTKRLTAPGTLFKRQAQGLLYLKNGNMGFNEPQPARLLHLTGKDANVGVMFEAYGPTGPNNPNIVMRSTPGLPEAPLTTTNGWLLGKWKGQGVGSVTDGVPAWWDGAAIQFEATQLWEDLKRGSKISFTTAANDDWQQLERLAIDSSGITVTGVVEPSDGIKFANATVQTTAATTTLPAGASAAIQINNGDGTFGAVNGVSVTPATQTINSVDLNLTAVNPTFIVDSVNSTAVNKAAAPNAVKTVSDRILPITTGYFPYSVGSTYAISGLFSDGTGFGMGSTTIGTDRLHIEHTNLPLRLTRTDSGTNNTAAGLTVTHKSSADAVDGYGAAVNFNMTDSGATNQLLGQLAFVRDGADNSGAFVVKPSVTGTATEKFRVATSGLATFSNAGGFPFGHMYFNDMTGLTISVLAADTWYAVNGAGTTFTTGQVKNVTFTDYYLTAVTAGYYEIHYSVSVDSSNVGDEIAATMAVNGTANVSAHNHSTVAAGNSAATISGVTVLNLAANDQVSIVVENHTAARDIIVHHAQLMIKYVGSP